MAKMLLTLISVVCCCISATAQAYHVPVNYKMAGKADYQRYESDVISTVNWLQDTPWTQDPGVRRKATDFLFKWIQDTPTITIEVMPLLIDLTDKNNLLMATFMGAYAKYAIEHPVYTKDEANIAATKALISKYRNEPTHQKDTDVEQIIRLEKSNLLDSWVRNEYERADRQ